VPAHAKSQVVDSVEQICTHARSALREKSRELENLGADVAGLHMLCVICNLPSDDDRLIEVVGEKQRCREDCPPLGEGAAVAGTAVTGQVVV
jgi:hypothetical protein